MLSLLATFTCSFYAVASVHYAKNFILQTFHTTLANMGFSQTSIVRVDSWMFMLGLTRTNRCQM